MQLFHPMECNNRIICHISFFMYIPCMLIGIQKLYCLCLICWSVLTLCCNFFMKKAFHECYKQIWFFFVWLLKQNMWVYGQQVLYKSWYITRNYILLMLSSCLWLWDQFHDDIMRWRPFPHYCPFVWGTHWLLVYSQHKEPVMWKAYCCLWSTLAPNAF